jgi:hypothetical protein
MVYVNRDEKVAVYMGELVEATNMKGLKCRIGTPIFRSPTRVSLQSVLQILLQIFHIPFTHVSAFSIKHRTQNATPILLHNAHDLGQLQIKRQSGNVVIYLFCIVFIIFP